MDGRCFASWGAVIVVGAAIWLMPVATIGQAQAPASPAASGTAIKPWTAARTSDGHPDLTGVWTNHSATPLERPKALEGRSSLTDEEVAQMRQRAARFRENGADNAPGDALFLAALSEIDEYKNPQATEHLEDADVKWFDNRTSLIVDPPDGKIPPLTPEGLQRTRARAAAAALPSGPEDMNNFMRCITYGVPRLGGNATDNGGYFGIFQTPGYFVLLDESNFDARVIPLDGRPHLPAGVRLWNGDSRGRWDGDTLVVDTTNFSEKSFYRGAAENLHVVERFTRSNADMIAYEITLDDPTTWTRPWTAVIHLKRSNDRIYESGCHEGNFDLMRDLLGAARADERAAGQNGQPPRQRGR